MSHIISKIESMFLCCPDTSAERGCNDGSNTDIDDKVDFESCSWRLYIDILIEHSTYAAFKHAHIYYGDIAVAWYI